MKLKGIILLACVYTTLGIRVLTRSNNIDCLICTQAVPFLKDALNNNETEVAILDHLEPMCDGNQQCEFIIPMILIHCVDYIMYHSNDQLCEPWCQAI